MIYLYRLPRSPSIPKQHEIDAAGWYACDDVTGVVDGPHPTREEALQSMMSGFKQQRNPFSDAWVGMYSDLPSVVWEPPHPIFGAFDYLFYNWCCQLSYCPPERSRRGARQFPNLPQSNEIVYDGTRDWADAPFAL